MWHPLKIICLTLWRVKEGYFEFTRLSGVNTGAAKRCKYWNRQAM
ncbi:hypothetical protein [Cardiobacterium valvarum]|uniref:Uncharacterized protein n=1 Tax=Cardiobacterium valvarum TaxID=194702 RepID=A0A381EE93_9GAMM|nr:hypothetical protein [Cardiobacterium valvarum]SUX25296.1 Uncharacterised protein [Cardiobacterium valvarum]